MWFGAPWDAVAVASLLLALISIGRSSKPITEQLNASRHSVHIWPQWGAFQYRIPIRKGSITTIFNIFLLFRFRKYDNKYFFSININIFFTKKDWFFMMEWRVQWIQSTVVFSMLPIIYFTVLESCKYQEYRAHQLIGRSNAHRFFKWQLAYVVACDILIL